mmetsp:Transcript_847/g.2064  ORF Transcript_847/g.2064 Transcript_847/m.2064 type:complete len:146 (+) Transcript_847:1130-1567(+)
MSFQSSYSSFQSGHSIHRTNKVSSACEAMDTNSGALPAPSEQLTPSIRWHGDPSMMRREGISHATAIAERYDVHSQSLGDAGNTVEWTRVSRHRRRESEIDIERKSLDRVCIAFVPSWSWSTAEASQNIPAEDGKDDEDGVPPMR